MADPHALRDRSEPPQNDTILERITDSFIALDREWRYTYVNHHAEAYVGRSREELLGQVIWELLPEVAGTHFERECRRAMSEQLPVHFNEFFPFLDSWFENHIYPDSEGLTIYSRDITQRMRTEAALRESELRFQIIAHATNDAVWDWNLTNGTMWWNEGITTLFGYAPAEVGLTREWWRERVHPHDRDRVVAALEAAVEGEGATWRAEYRLARADGSYAYVLDRGRIIRGAAGQATRMLGALVDLTERRHMEEALRASESRFHIAFTASPFASGIADLKTGELLDVNEAFLAAFGYTREEVIGRTSVEIGLWDRPEDRADIAARLVAGERVRERETVVRTKHGERRLTLVSAEIIEIDDRPCILTASSDITVRKELEERLMQAQRMEAVGRLAGGVAHDFNNLLTVISGYTDIALKRVGDDSLRIFLDEVKDAAVRAAGLTQQLLAFSRKQLLQPKVVDLNDTVANIEKMLQRLIGEDVELEVRLAPAASPVYADPGQIEQVIMNLAVNARDAMPDGGRLTIETANVTIEEPPVGAGGVAEPKAYVMVAVKDTGVGMDDATRPRIFEPFFTTKAHGKGTGLGLSTVFGIVTQSEGFIRVDSRLGAGTTFRIYLPRMTRGSRVADTAVDAPVVSGRGQTVLLTEDEDAVRRLARLALEESGYRVLEAATGDEALALVERHDGEIDLVLTDVVMPGMSGPRLVERLRERIGPIRVLYMSGYTDDAISHHGVIDPGVALLNKPFTPDELARKVYEVFTSARA